ncbi:MAG: hypothetical protein JNN25_09475 [Candidatus Kapabacteria bacterium]|nr:hypothetical protein [Candidatus Kapabacteria bacterium]
MINAVLFVEGSADVKFLQDFVNYHFDTTLKKGTHIIDCEGNGGLAAQKPQFERFALEGLTSCIIFDADSEKQKTNFQATQGNIYKELEGIISAIQDERPNLSVKFDVFLLPNNSDDGDLETLLERIINPDNQPILDCWNGYERCIEQQRTAISRTLSLPIRKSKIYSYMEILHGTSKKERENAKEVNRNYANKQDWQLEHSAAQALHIFLKPYFDSTSNTPTP